MKYIVFDDACWENFLPFTHTRPTGDLRAGIFKLRQKIGLIFKFKPDNVVIRKDLKKICEKRHPSWCVNMCPKTGDYMFINSRLRTHDYALIRAEIKKLKINQKLVLKNDIIAFRLKLNSHTHFHTEDLHKLYDGLESVISKVEKPLWNYTWEILKYNGDMILEDWKMAFRDDDEDFAEVELGVIVINPYSVWIGAGTNIKPGVILDATSGPILIDESVEIKHNAVILGPAYIGKHSIINAGTRICKNTSIGPNCRIGGEIADSIFQGFSNKQHDGYLGKSYIGEWVNIGAGTNNSDLKNNYKNVKSWFYPAKSKIDTGELFLGCFIGDHSKIGINCAINTGTVIGIGANIYGSELISDYIDSFSWGDGKNRSEYDFDKFIETASVVKKRRDEMLIDEEIEVLRNIINRIKNLSY